MHHTAGRRQRKHRNNRVILPRTAPPMKFSTPFALLVLAALLCITPVMGIDRNLGGSPGITAYLSGTSEFSAGQDATITVILQNSGTDTVKFVGVGTIAPADRSTTAKFVTVGLSPGSAPVVVRTQPQRVSDIPASGTATAAFTTKITSDATQGEYQLPLFVRYQYLSNELENQVSDQIIDSRYTSVNLTIPLTIRILPAVSMHVTRAEPSDLAVGTQGFVNVSIENTGADGRQAAVRLLRNDGSAIIPVDDSIYVGDFPRDGTVACRYRVAVSAQARQQVYPVDVVVTYVNAEGDTVTSEPATVGIPVGPKPWFSVTSPAAVIDEGTTRVITVKYRNEGTVTTYQARARITVTDPFTSTDTTAWLGDIPPGGEGAAVYSIRAGGTAQPGPYAFDTVIAYQDALDTSQVTDPFSTPLIVGAPAGSAAYMNVPVIAILLVIATGAGYYILVMRKRR